MLQFIRITGDDVAIDLSELVAVEGRLAAGPAQNRLSRHRREHQLQCHQRTPTGRADHGSAVAPIYARDADPGR